MHCSIEVTFKESISLSLCPIIQETWQFYSSNNLLGVNQTHLTSVFSLLTSVFTLPYGNMLMAFANVHMDVAGC